MKVWIQPLKSGQKRFSVDADPKDTISVLKKKIEEAKGVQSNNQRLVHLGQVLRDDAHLQDQGVSDTGYVLLYTKPAPVIKPPEAIPPAATEAAAAVTAPVHATPVMAPGALPFNPIDVQNILRNLVNTYIPPGPNYLPPGGAPPAQPGTMPPAAAPPTTATAPPAQPAVRPPPPRVAAPVVDPAQVQILMEAGFSENAAKKALLFNGGDPNGAMEWLLEHSNDLDLDLPLNPAQMRAILQQLGPQHVAAPAGAAGANVALPQPRVDPAVEQCMNAGNCSFHTTGKTYKPQFYFHCYTCGFKDNEGCCAACIRQCHRGHRISEPVWSSGFYCDCGAGSRFQCKSMPNS